MGSVSIFRIFPGFSIDLLPYCHHRAGRCLRLHHQHHERPSHAVQEEGVQPGQPQQGGHLQRQIPALRAAGVRPLQAGEARPGGGHEHQREHGEHEDVGL